jgi:tetratricopeptide (TPR) repeat protein
MKNSFETSFISQTVEKTPFADTPAQNFFTEWCRINDSIVPEFVSREDWEQRGVQGILEKNDQGKQTLFLPEDLHLWEMMDIIKTVDHDTLARKPEKRKERANQIQELGATFEKAGLYFSEYLPTLDEDNGGSIAQDIAREFYQYGLSLQHKEQKIEDIPEESSLSNEDKTKLDEWFLGRDVYKNRLARLGENPTEEQIEDMRKKLLSVYFKALTREGYKAEGEKPWEIKAGPMQRLQDKTRRQITKAVETPEREMKTTFFRRGVEKLISGMGFDKILGILQELEEKNLANSDSMTKIDLDNLKYLKSFKTTIDHWQNLDYKSLYQALHIDELKQELKEVKETKDVNKISAKELEIAKKIQKTVSSFPYKKNANNPSEMVENQLVNCVGSSILGGGLLDEIGIKYLHADLLEHSATVLITSDSKVYWQDFTPLNKSDVNYAEITSDMLEGNTDLVDLTNIQDSGLTINFRNWEIDNKKLRVNLFRPETGLQSHILNNTGIILNDLNKNKEAIEAYQQAINVGPKNIYPFNGLGNSLSNLGRNKEAIEVYHQAISVDPKCAVPFNGLGGVLSALGRNEEAIQAYEQFIKLWNSDDYWTNRAKGEIEKLQQKIFR